MITLIATRTETKLIFSLYFLNRHSLERPLTGMIFIERTIRKYIIEERNWILSIIFVIEPKHCLAHLFHIPYHDIKFFEAESTIVIITERCPIPDCNSLIIFIDR